MKSYVAKGGWTLPQRVEAGVIAAAEFRQDGSGKLYTKGENNSRTLLVVEPGFKLPNVPPYMNVDGGDYAVRDPKTGKSWWMPKDTFEGLYRLTDEAAAEANLEAIRELDEKVAKVGKQLLGEIVEDRQGLSLPGENIDQTIERLAAEAEEERAALALVHSRRYVRKNFVNEAFQVTKATRGSNITWPAWMHEAWRKDPHEVGSVHPTKHHNSEGDDKLAVTMDMMSQHDRRPHTLVVAWGDYIVRTPEGTLTVWHGPAFEEMFVPMRPDQLPAKVLTDEVTAKPRAGVPVDDSPLWTEEQRKLSASTHMDYYGETLGWKD